MLSAVLPAETCLYARKLAVRIELPLCSTRTAAARLSRPVTGWSVTGRSRGRTCRQFDDHHVTSSSSPGPRGSVVARARGGPGQVPGTLGERNCDDGGRPQRDGLVSAAAAPSGSSGRSTRLQDVTPVGTGQWHDHLTKPLPGHTVQEEIDGMVDENQLIADSLRYLT